MIKGLLAADGFRASKDRIHATLQLIDPVGCAIRRAGLIIRRKYQVSGLNALWHIDGNHKLICWGFVIHGCIDGNTRFMIYLKCRTNNYAVTVGHCFVEATRIYGVPSRVHGDHGGENQIVGMLMLWWHGLGRGSFLCGCSVHNQRIE